MHPSSPSHPPFSLNKLILMKREHEGDEGILFSISPLFFSLFLNDDSIFHMFYHLRIPLENNKCQHLYPLSLSCPLSSLSLSHILFLTFQPKGMLFHHFSVMFFHHTRLQAQPWILISASFLSHFTSVSFLTHMSFRNISPHFLHLCMFCIRF
jgi:hypothetical protein